MKENREEMNLSVDSLIERLKEDLRAKKSGELRSYIESHVYTTPLSWRNPFKKDSEK